MCVPPTLLYNRSGALAFLRSSEAMQRRQTFIAELRAIYIPVTNLTYCRSRCLCNVFKTLALWILPHRVDYA
jgi:hypothetical protein